MTGAEKASGIRGTDEFAAFRGKSGPEKGPLLRNLLIIQVENGFVLYFTTLSPAIGA